LKRAGLALLLTLVVVAFSAQAQVFRVNFGDAPIANDPARGQTALEAQVLSALYEGLVTYDPVTLRPAPGAAESWEFSSDNLTLTFRLRPNLRFADDTPLTAQDFAETWVRLLNPETQAPFASLLDPIKGVQQWREGKLTDRSRLGIQTPSKDRLVLTFQEPAPQMVSILAHYSFVPLPASWRKTFPDATSFPPENGPYVVESRAPGRWLLQRNANYWDAAQVKIERMEFTFRNDAEEVTKEFKEGKYAWLADGIDYAATINGRLVSATSLFGTSFFFVRSDRAPWNDVRVRQALIQLLPLEELRKIFLQPTSVLVPWFEGYPKVEPLLADRERALKLLADAGFPGGNGLPSVRLVLPSDSEMTFYEEFFNKAWEEIGLKVTPVEVDDAYYDQLDASDATLGYFSWIGDFLDPVTFLYLWKGRSSLNSFDFASVDFDQLLEQSAKETKIEDRLKLLGKAEEYLLQQGLLIPLSHTPGFSLIDQTEVGGWYANPLDLHPFKSLYWKPPVPIKNTVRFDLP